MLNYLKLIFSILFLLLGEFSFSQVPQSFNYQAAARNKKGEALANKTLVVEVSILRSTENGAIEYQEIHRPTTNEFGLFSLEIGAGQPTFAGTVPIFSSIEWEKHNYYVKIRVDFGDAQQTNGLVDMGVTRLQSVPYSFISRKALFAETLSSPVSLQLADLADINISNPQNNQTLIWNASQSKWTAGESGSFLDSNGSTDLTGNWAISTNNIQLGTGNFTLNTGNLLLGSGNIELNSGKIKISGGSLIVENGSANMDSLQLEFGQKINRITTDGTLAGNSNFTIPTEQAVRTYVANNSSGGTGSTDNGIWNTSASAIFLSDSRFVAVGTSSPSDKVHFQLAQQEGFLVTGISGGSLPNLGQGTRLAFYPAKAVFRAGHLLDLPNAWNGANSGFASVAFGQDNIASGDFSFVGGIKNMASGHSATAFGNSNMAGGASAFAVGENSQALGTGSFSAGISTHAGTYAETAFGTFNYSDGNSTDNWGITETLFSVGNGTSDASRSNAFVIMKYGGTGIGLGQTAPIAMFQVGTAGDGTIAIANAWNTFSDRRLKKDILVIDRPIEKLEAISGYYYFWKQGKDKNRQAGVIAQEVLAVYPEIVTKNTDGIYSVDYSKLTPLLIEGTKAQQKEIDLLRAENQSLRLKIERQNLRLESIEKYIGTGIKNRSVKASANVKMNK